MTSKTNKGHNNAPSRVEENAKLVHQFENDAAQLENKASGKRVLAEAACLTTLIALIEEKTIADEFNVQDICTRRRELGNDILSPFYEQLHVLFGYRNADGSAMEEYDKKFLSARQQMYRRVMDVAAIVMENGGSKACQFNKDRTNLLVKGSLCLAGKEARKSDSASVLWPLSDKGMTISLSALEKECSNVLQKRHDDAKAASQPKPSGGQRGETGKARTEDKSGTSDKSSKSGTGQTTQGTASQAEGWKQESHGFNDRIKWLRDTLAIQPDNAAFSKETLTILAQLDHEIRRFVDPDQYERQPQKAQTNGKSNNANTRAAK